MIAEIFIEQLKEQHRFSASADAGNDFDLAIPHITNEPIQIIVALNHFFHLELVTLCEYVEQLVLGQQDKKLYLFIDEVQLTAKVIDQENGGIEVT